MVSIGVELQKVLDLAPEYTRVPSPSMRARDEACRRLQDELRKVLTTIPAAANHKLDVGGGRAAGELQSARLGSHLFPGALWPNSLRPNSRMALDP